MAASVRSMLKLGIFECRCLQLRRASTVQQGHATEIRFCVCSCLPLLELSSQPVAFKYVCMYVRMDGWMNGWMYECIYACTSTSDESGSQVPYKAITILIYEALVNPII